MLILCDPDSACPHGTKCSQTRAKAQSTCAGVEREVSIARPWFSLASSILVNMLSDSDEGVPEDSEEEDLHPVTEAGDCVHDPSNPWLAGRKSTKMSEVSPVLLLDSELKGHRREMRRNILNLREQSSKRMTDSVSGERDNQRVLYDVCEDGDSEEQLIETCGNAEIDDDALQSPGSARVQTEQACMDSSSLPQNQTIMRPDQPRLDSVVRSTEPGKADSNSVTKCGHIDPHSFMLTEDRGESSLGRASEQLLAVHEAFAGKSRLKSCMLCFT